ncbi:hypothetical protein M422DRAFT_51294, partial [Sphaerobolus stellatus SS14]
DSADVLESDAKQTEDDQDELQDFPSELFIPLQDYIKRNLLAIRDLCRQGHLHKRRTHMGVVYSSCHAAIRDSLVMVELAGRTTYPAQIQSIFSAYRGPAIIPVSIGIFVCVRTFRPADTRMVDPYVEFPIWNARLHRNDTHKEDLILPISAVHSHFAHMPFDEHHGVVIPLDRVGSSICYADFH